MRQGMELLAPAGSMEILKAVIDAGADAVYLGGNRFGARAYANNFSTEELMEALDYAHLRDKKIYLTVNTLFKNEEIEELRAYLLPLYEHGLDAVLVQDFGALIKIYQWFPDMEIHTSTQMTITGSEGVKFLQQYGVTRVVMAREVSIEEMKNIYDETNMELEAFVHGALCYCYSGQCLLSSVLGGRSGNRGRCAQPCRLPYTVLSSDKKCIKNESYILSLKDFCCIQEIDKLYEAGVYSLKIEGRMKQLSYAAGVVSTYRKYVDKALSNYNYHVDPYDYHLLETYGNRCGFTDGYLYKHNNKDMVTYDKPSFCQTKEDTKTNRSYRPIKGLLIIKSGEPMKLSIWDQNNHSVTVYANEPDKAQKLPITADDVKKRIQKTRDTAFLFDSLSIELDEGLFVPNGTLNQLKRDALLQLQNQILHDYYRQDRWTKGQAERIFVHEKKDTEEAHIVSIENRSVLPILLSSKIITEIYIDWSAYDRSHLISFLDEDVQICKKAGKKVYYIFPSIFRKHTAQFYEQIVNELDKCELDGFVVKNLEAFWFVKNHFSSARIICDHNLYTYNDAAKDGYLLAGADGVTIPFELNRKEIARRNNQLSEIWVYGYYPLMTSAQCVCNNTTGCNHVPGIRYIKDRMKKDFPVKNCCSECINIIYNSLPTMLFQNIEELRSYQIKRFRLHFSIETADVVRKLLVLYEEFVLGQRTNIPEDWQESYTNGHYKRGVE